MSNALPAKVVQEAGLPPLPPQAQPNQAAVPVVDPNVPTPSTPYSQPSVPSKRSVKTQEQAKHHSAMASTLQAVSETLSTLRNRVESKNRVVDLTIEDQEIKALKKQRLQNAVIESDLNTFRASMNDTATFDELDPLLQLEVKNTYSNLLREKIRRARIISSSSSSSSSTTNTPLASNTLGFSEYSVNNIDNNLYDDYDSAEFYDTSSYQDSL